VWGPFVVDWFKTGNHFVKCFMDALGPFHPVHFLPSPSTHPEDADCNVHQNTGTISIYDKATPQKVKLHMRQPAKTKGQEYKQVTIFILYLAHSRLATFLKSIYAFTQTF
jgi:hypothetical protein